eukprot:7014706-Pyramimonas_sp.AAC.1
MDGKRGSLWKEKRVFYATPQTIANDLQNGTCPAQQIVCLVALGVDGTGIGVDGIGIGVDGIGIGVD